MPLVVDVTTLEGKDLSQFLIDARFAVRLELRSVSPEDLDSSVLSSISEPSVQHQSPAEGSQALPPGSKPTPDDGDCESSKPDKQCCPDESLKSGGDSPGLSFCSVTVQKTYIASSTESHLALSQSAVDAISDGAIPPAFPHPCGYGSWTGDTDISRLGTALCHFPKRKVCLKVSLIIH